MLRAEELHKITRDDTIISIFPTGAIASIEAGSVRINQSSFLPHELPLSNIWVKLSASAGNSNLFPLLDPAAETRVTALSDGVRIRRILSGGLMADLRFTLLSGKVWSWTITLQAPANQTNEELTAEFLFIQDIGLADEGALLTNELYAAQYLDIRARRHDGSYLLEYRQNLAQGDGSKPALQIGVHGANVTAFATDQMQFPGPKTRAIGLRRAVEAAFEDPAGLPSEVRQYELPLAVMRTEPKRFHDRKLSIEFYNRFESDLPEGLAMDKLSLAIPDLRLPRLEPDAHDLTAEGDVVEQELQGEGPFASDVFTGLLHAFPPDEEMIDGFYPHRLFQEIYGAELGAFYTPNGTHVVLPPKERIQERPGAHMLLRNMQTELIDNNVIASTNFSFGLFNSQVLVGNTNYHKLISKNRGQLNLSQGSGQRLYIKRRDGWKLLAEPSVYEMGLNYSRWLYFLEDDCIEVRSWVAFDRNRVRLDASSRDGKIYEFLLTQELAAGESELSDHYEIRASGETGSLIFTLKKDSFQSAFYPDLNFRMTFIGNYRSLDDGIFYTDGKPRLSNFLVHHFAGNHLSVIIEGDAEAALEEIDTEPLNFRRSVGAYRDFYHGFLNSMELTLADNADEIDKIRVKKLNMLAPWYLHDALVHFISPHGIEQAEGAAWGTRDVCQGPFELFMATGHFPLVRRILLRIFSRQVIDYKEWPQWFMFDRYQVFAGEHHGDVVFWPLKALAEYIIRTGDQSILDEEVAYISQTERKDSVPKDSVFKHVRLAVASIRERSRLVPGLVNYAGGDWDDTLQPASHEAAEQLVSAWTAALQYQVITALGKSLGEKDPTYAAECAAFANEIQESFHAHMIIDGIIPGFMRRQDGKDSYILHPRDEVTGIRYRLLPLSRSIIAGLVDKDQAEQNLALIATELRHPDGARLMSSPVPYTNGNPTIFRRAEQAVNVGREVSLQYVHAHIRYIEALCQVGHGAEAWDAINRIVPIRIMDELPNALPRQSNVYFSSSDPDVNTRFEFSRRFAEIKEGKVAVRGGWRLYSSGPGIFLNQIITSFLGLELMPGGIRVNPAIPPELAGLKLKLRYREQAFAIVYRRPETVVGEQDKLLTLDRGVLLDQNDLPQNENGRPLTIAVLSSADTS